MLNKHTVLYTIAKFLPSLAGFVTITVCSYYLSPSEVGKYNVVYSGTLLINALLFQWLRVTLARFYYKYEGEEQERFVNTIMFFCGVTLAICLSVTLVLIGIKSADIVFYSLGFVWLSIFSIYDINLELHRTTLNSKYYLRVELIKSVVHIILSTALMIIFKSFYVIIFAYILSQAIPLGFYKHKRMSIRGKLLDTRTIISILKFGFPLALMLSSSFINNTIDRILIANYLNIEQAGLYSVGYDMFRQALWIPFVIINLANFPILIKLYEEGKLNNLQIKLKENIEVLITISIIVGTIVFTNCNEIVLIFIGKSFRQTAKDIMPYITVSTILYGLSIFHFNYSFQFKSKTILLACIYLTGSLTKIAINIIFLSKYGLIVAAQTTLITYAMILLLSIMVGNKQYELPKFNYLHMLYLLIVSFVLYKMGQEITIKNSYLSILMKSSFVLGVYLFVVYKLKIFKVNISRFRFG